jgi:hypothetical protein
MNNTSRPTSFRSAFFGLCGAGIGFLLLLVFVYSMVILPDLGNVEIAIVSRFGPQSFIRLILVLLPLVMLSGCLIGFGYARATACHRKRLRNTHSTHPLD